MQAEIKKNEKIFDSICVQVFSSLEEEKNKIEEKLRQVSHSNPLFYFTHFTIFIIFAGFRNLTPSEGDKFSIS